GTTLWRYSTFIIIYVATMEMLWLVFALAPGLPGMPGTVSDNLKRLQPALASALALTLFLSDMPWIRPLEARWRGWLHAWAGIPKEARALAERLHTSALMLSEETGRSGRSELIDGLGLLADEHFAERLEPEPHPATQLVRLSAIRLQLETWRDKHRLAG